MARRWTQQEEIYYTKELQKFYVKQNMTISEVGKILGIAESSAMIV